MEGHGTDSRAHRRSASAQHPQLTLVATTDEATIHTPEALRVIPKPWGREVWWAVADRYVGKRIEVTAGHSLSLQYHELKHETLYFLSGEVRLLLGDQERLVGPGSVAVVPPGTVHRVEALTAAVIFEVSTPELDDVVRLEDRYGRAPAAGAPTS